MIRRAWLWVRDETAIWFDGGALPGAAFALALAGAALMFAMAIAAAVRGIL